MQHLPDIFHALLVRDDGGTVKAAVEPLHETALPPADTLIDVHYSSLNYKDALAVTGKGKVIRGAYPFVPGIDLAGEVVSSESGDLEPGDLVVGTGWGLGENRWGGYAERQRVPSEWLVRLPESLSPVHAMAVGTAGLTAMLAIQALQEHGVERGSEVLVTGASGGVGSMGVVLLARHGYRVVASTRSSVSHEYLRRLGAQEIVDSRTLSEFDSKPLESARWSGAIDVVGGKTLAAIIAMLKTHGAVAVCGLAGGPELNTTVYPFILRGVSLLGIDSNTCPMDRRRRAWHTIAQTLSSDDFERMTTTVEMEKVPHFAARLLAGETTGRVVVEVRPRQVQRVRARATTSPD